MSGRSPRKQAVAPDAVPSPPPSPSAVLSKPDVPTVAAGFPADLKPYVVLAGAMAEAAVITGGDWRQGGVEILFANDAFGDLTGYGGEHAAANTRALHGPRTELAVLQAREGGGGEPGGVVRGEAWLHRRNGAEFYSAWVFTPLPVAGEVRYLGIYRDMTETRRLQQALLHTQKLDTVGQLAGGVAHDFNNLLSVINGYCEILTPKIATLPAATRDLQEIHRAGLKAATVARQILEFSRRSDDESRVVNCNVLVREIADMLRRGLGDDIALELRLASDLGNTRADPTQFQQAILNLAFNARNAMPQGGKLTVRTANRVVTAKDRKKLSRLRPGNYVAVSVTDTGSGMDAELQRRIFEPFFTTRPSGTGLGLPTVRYFVRQFDGSITVESEVGRGSTFEILLPETAEAAVTFSTALPVLPAVRGSEAVLLVEEDEVLRKMIAGILTTDGYQVIQAATVAEAGGLVGEGKIEPQLLVVDCGVASAAALARSLHGANPALRVLSVSIESAAAALREFRPGNVAHLPKPFALSTLLRTVRSVLDHGLR